MTDESVEVSNVIEFPSGAGLQREKDRMKTKPATVNTSIETQLLNLCRFYIQMNNITDTGAIYSDAVANTALDLVQEICSVVGFHKPQTPGAA